MSANNPKAKKARQFVVEYVKAHPQASVNDIARVVNAQRLPITKAVITAIKRAA